MNGDGENDLAGTREAEIRARAEAATGGPWEMDEIPETGECAVFGQANAWYTDGQSLICTHAHYSDADFIAHARTDIEYLLAELQILRDERHWAQHATQSARDMVAMLLISHGGTCFIPESVLTSFDRSTVGVTVTDHLTGYRHLRAFVIEPDDAA